MSALSRIARDPLLLIARGILYLLIASMVIGIAGCLAGMVGLFAFEHRITLEMAREIPAQDFGQFRWILEGVLVLVIALLAMLLRIFLLLKRIVDTVGEGDPFVPENAARLTQMAWLAVGVQLVSIPIAAFGVWVDKLEEAGSKAGDLQINGGLDGNGLLLVLILFILARVFRKGAEMRAELEGTV